MVITFTIQLLDLGIRYKNQLVLIPFHADKLTQRVGMTDFELLHGFVIVAV